MKKKKRNKIVYMMICTHISNKLKNKARKRKELMPAETISNFELLAPYKDKYKDFVLSQTFDHKYEAVAYLDHPDNYVCVYTNEKGESCCTIFQCNMKFLKLFKFHFKNTVDSELTIKE